MAQLLKNATVIDDDWTFASDDLTSLPSTDKLLISFSQGQQLADQLDLQAGNIGLWLEADSEIDPFPESFLNVPIIVVKFSKFVDGRGFSLARLLRERYQYNGELRAIGDIIRDQLYLLKHCGFNAFQFNDDIDLAQAAKSLNDFSDSYQTSTEQPIPLFRRR